MASSLIIESGSTKTDWCLLQKGKKPLCIQTSGINPRLQTADAIADILETELQWNHKKHQPDTIVYYGAGVGNAAKEQMISDILRKHFGVKKPTVYSDMMAAAHSLCGDDKGIVCILGTGSNSCYYNGKAIKEQQPSLGYIAGDEGSGNYLGKRVLQYYAYKTFDTELTMAFEQLFGSDLQQIINQLYHEPFPNRYLATFVQLLKANRGHFMVENILEDGINDFFHHHILKYRQSWKSSLYFTGSVAFEFQDIIANLCDQYELTLGKVEKSPLKGLIKYHS